MEKNCNQFFLWSLLWAISLRSCINVMLLLPIPFMNTKHWKYVMLEHFKMLFLYVTNFLNPWCVPLKWHWHWLTMSHRILGADAKVSLDIPKIFLSSISIHLFVRLFVQGWDIHEKQKEENWYMESIRYFVPFHWVFSSHFWLNIRFYFWNRLTVWMTSIELRME